MRPKRNAQRGNAGLVKPPSQSGEFNNAQHNAKSLEIPNIFVNPDRRRRTPSECPPSHANSGVSVGSLAQCRVHLGGAQ